MKKLIYLIISVVMLGSCATSSDVVSNNLLMKRKYRKGWHLHINEKFRKSSTHNETGSFAEADDRSADVNKINSAANTSTEPNNETYSIPVENTKQISGVGLTKRETLELDAVNENDCDEIIKRDGDIVIARIMEVGVTEIKFKKCDNPEGPTYSILKSEVFMIKYPNGTTDVFKEEANRNNAQPHSGEGSLDYLGLSGLILGLIGLVVFLFASWPLGAILGLFTLILGGISLTMEKNNPGRWTTKKSLGIASLILGSLLLFFGIILLLL